MALISDRSKYVTDQRQISIKTPDMSQISKWFYKPGALLLVPANPFRRSETPRSPPPHRRQDLATTTVASSSTSQSSTSIATRTPLDPSSAIASRHAP
ncbi:hypothetical protein Scep_015277 [Stephania cephalantha]|uniref:Uncharacterized protein n=1 Tax=Stephania cephalantha TaxID=152367 RepID=A0AAP0P3S5_9MAGN